MQVRYQLRHRPISKVSPLAATLQAYYIGQARTNTGQVVGAPAPAVMGMTGQSFHSRSRP